VTTDHNCDVTSLYTYQFLFLVLFLIFLSFLVPYSRLSWLAVSFWAHIVSYRRPIESYHNSNGNGVRGDTDFFGAKLQERYRNRAITVFFNII